MSVGSGYAGVLRLARCGLVAGLLACASAVGAAEPEAAPLWLAAANQLFENRPPAGLSFSDAASRARHETGGQVISVAPAEQNGRAGFRVKVLLEDGRVRTLFVEQRTGQVIDPRRDD